MTEESKKPVFRIVLEKAMNRELEELKVISGVTIAEHFRRAMKMYLLFRESGGEVDDVAMMRFFVDWQSKQNRKSKAAK